MSAPEPSALADRLTGALLGTCLGDALGLPAEGMSSRAISARFGRMDRFRLLGSTGFGSDDTEQTALVAEALARHPADPELCASAFRQSLVYWCFRLPWGAGLATLRACARIMLRLHPTGVRSAGDGAAMRAAVIGVFFFDRPDARLAFGTALAAVTHLDVRAVEGALYTAELAACCASSAAGDDRFEAVRKASEVITNPELLQAIQLASKLAEEGSPAAVAARECGTSGYVVHAAGFATFCFLRHGDEPMEALVEAIGAGGDTDTIAAILGAWLGALHGEAGFPAELISRINNGPFGPSHLRALGNCLNLIRQGHAAPPPRYSAPAALARNLALYPVILAHGLRRLIGR